MRSGERIPRLGVVPTSTTPGQIFKKDVRALTGGETVEFGRRRIATGQFRADDILLFLQGVDGGGLREGDDVVL
jgi:hypothetical protein